MTVIRWLCAVAIFAAAGAASARCSNGNTSTCSVDGIPGTRMCMDGEWSECLVTPPTTTYNVTASYKVLSVIYAPPGTQNGGSGSSVTYSTGSSSGTTTSSTNAFDQGYNVTASATVGANAENKDPGTGISATFGYGRNSSNTKAIDISKSATTTINHRGPSVDGVDHDRDQIWLWLNPKMILTLSEAGGQWAIAPQTMEIQYVYVGQLKRPETMPPGVAARLAAAGITQADYAEILEADPYAYGTPALDPERYKPLNTTFPYQPPYAPGDPVPVFGYTMTYTDTTTFTSSRTNTYTVGLAATGINLPFLHLKLGISNKWTWTDIDTRSVRNANTESAQVAVGGPSYGYTGPTLMSVYYDVLYKTFLFVPVTGPVQLQGVLTSGSKESVGGREVILTGSNGVEYRTFTNARGEYRFDETPDGPATLSAGGERRVLQRAASARNVDLQIQ